ncbi:uncharacterized protein G2W53_001320 [Senna tora]|uniref:Uncharacterized protein n=1 Tax=Senna tora TaxID=362788 RepID=A0A834XHB5_9FABA|nr:uncharacterized protein G2W53_001320 [Senna tora]
MVYKETISNRAIEDSTSGQLTTSVHHGELTSFSRPLATILCHSDWPNALVLLATTSDTIFLSHSPPASLWRATKIF